MFETTTVERLHEAVAEVDRYFADTFNAGDPEQAARGVYTTDALAMPPGSEMIRGRDEIAQFWGAVAKQMRIERVELSTVELTSSGEFAHQVGRAVLTLAGNQRVPCKYVVIWKQESGGWKWHIDIWNADQ